MKEKAAVIVSRKWNNPQIMCVVNKQGIQIGMKLDDFVEGLVKEIGNPLGILSVAQLRSKAMKAMETVVDEMKNTSTHVV